jgi:hypothetical protein
VKTRSLRGSFGVLTYGVWRSILVGDDVRDWNLNVIQLYVLEEIACVLNLSADVRRKQRIVQVFTIQRLHDSYAALSEI